MNKKMIAVAVLMVIVITTIATWYVFLREEEVLELNEQSPLDQDNSTVIMQGKFNSTTYNVKGYAFLIRTGEGYILRFEDFESDTGPGLYIYLSTAKNDDDFVNLGKIKAHKGNINYDVPPDTDLEKYNVALVWCEPFSALFGYAELNPV